MLHTLIVAARAVNKNFCQDGSYILVVTKKTKHVTAMEKNTKQRNLQCFQF